MNTRKRIFYVPGLISLTVLPIVLLYYAVAPSHKIPRMLAVIMTDSSIYTHPPAWLRPYIHDTPPKRNYLDIVPDGSQGYNNVRLDFAQLRIREIVTANDTVNGIHFRFTDSATYGNFVRVLDMLHKERAQTYLVMDENIWFWEYSQPKETAAKTEPEVEASLENDVVYQPPPPPPLSWWKLTWDAILHADNGGVILIALCIFILIAIIVQQKKQGA